MVKTLFYEIYLDCAVTRHFDQGIIFIDRYG